MKLIHDEVTGNRLGGGVWGMPRAQEAESFSFLVILYSSENRHSSDRRSGDKVTSFARKFCKRFVARRTAQMAGSAAVDNALQNVNSATVSLTQRVFY